MLILTKKCATNKTKTKGMNLKNTLLHECQTNFVVPQNEEIYLGFPNFL